jgi:hypothetical protein
MQWVHGGDSAFSAWDGTHEFFIAWVERRKQWKWDTWRDGKMIAKGVADTSEAAKECAVSAVAMREALTK